MWPHYVYLTGILDKFFSARKSSNWGIIPSPTEQSSKFTAFAPLSQELPSCLASGDLGGKSQDLSSASLETTRFLTPVAYSQRSPSLYHKACTDLSEELWRRDGKQDSGRGMETAAAAKPPCWLPCPAPFAHPSQLQSSLPRLLTARTGWSGFEWQHFISLSLESALMRYAD